MFEEFEVAGPARKPNGGVAKNISGDQDPISDKEYSNM